jgi:hypothetical protein
LEYILEVKVICLNTSCRLLYNWQKAFAIKLHALGIHPGSKSSSFEHLSWTTLQLTKSICY